MRLRHNIPDDLYRRIKAKADLEDISVRKIVVRALQAELGKRPRRTRVEFPLIRGEPEFRIDLTNEDINEIPF